MKPRRVLVSLECETAEPLKGLRNRDRWNREYLSCDVVGKLGIRQIQVNVVQPNPKKKARKK